ncbi:hypothetical protein [Paraburkholderia humisilvae]
MCEWFFGRLEAELLSREHFATHEQARRRIFSFLEGWYSARQASWQHWLLFAARIRRPLCANPDAIAARVAHGRAASWW